MFKVNQDAYARLFAKLLEYPCSSYELADHTGLRLVTVQSLMRCLNNHKVVHIVDWEKNRLGRDTTPVYAFGKGSNKRREAKTPVERQTLYRERLKQKKLFHMTAGKEMV